MSGIVFGCIVPHPPIIIPEIGKGRESEISSTIRAMEKLAEKLAASRPDVIFVISPHGTAHYDAMGVVTTKSLLGNLRSWGASNLNFRFNADPDITDALQEEAHKANIPIKAIGERGYNLDHGVLVPFYFLNRKVSNATLVPLTFCWLPLSTHYDFGKLLAKFAVQRNKRVAIVASGDLSHRLIPEASAGYDPQGEVFDKKINDAVSTLDSNVILNMDKELIERAGECGLRSITILMGALDGLKARPEVLSYEGPFGVGYMVASFEIDETAKPVPEAVAKTKADIEEKPESELHPLVALAKSTVEGFIKNGVTPTPVADSDELKERAGVFVSIKKKGELRGCIGTFEPTKSNVAEEIVSSAIGAAIRDPRFLPITANELADLYYSVDVLSKPEPVANTDELDPKKYGVIVDGMGRRGLLLPNLETVDTVEEQIDIARSKAGLAPDDEIKLYRFEVKRYK
ncbi:AmmeMemoRadiSam system protein A [Chloroflexota bacterium]